MSMECNVDTHEIVQHERDIKEQHVAMPSVRLLLPCSTTSGPGCSKVG